MGHLEGKGISRRSLFKMGGVAAAAVVAGGALTACSSPSSNNGGSSGDLQTASSPFGGEGGGNIPATIGYWGGSPCELPVYIAIMQNYFQESGIEPNIVKITSDTSILLANDEIDCFESTPGDFMALYNGTNLKLLDTIHVGCWSGATLSDEINSCKDLEGKTVGTTMINGPAFVEVQALCAREGGDNSKINWVTYSGSLISQALQNGEIEAAVASDASIYPIRENIGAKLFYLSAEELTEYYCCFIGCNSRSLEKNPDLGDRLAKAFAMAVDYINEDPDRAINESMENGYANATYPDIQRELTKNYMFNHGNKEDMYASVKERWQELYDSKLLSQAPSDPSEVDAYLDELTDMVIDWRGDVASDTAEKLGTAALIAANGRPSA